MRWYEEEFRSKLHALRQEYDLLRPALDLVSRVVDAEVKKVTRSTHRPTLSDSRIKDLDGMRLKFVDLYDAFNARITECERHGETVSARAVRDRLRRFLDDPIPHVHDVIGLRYVTTYSYHDFRRRIAPRFRALRTDDEEAEHWTVDYSPRLPSGEDRREEMAEHLVGRLTDAQIAVAIMQGEREGLAVTEDQLRKLPFEIQLRTTVVHAWTVISHERLYKVSGRTKVAGDMAKLGREVLQIQAAFDRITDEDDLWLDHLMERLARQSTSGEYKFEDLAKRERLLAEPCTDDQALSAYAMYRFYDTSFYGPTNEVSPLWIALCARTLAETGLATIADLDAHVNGVIDEVIAYRDEVRDEHPNIFKDATDWLSKCLIFSLPEFQRHYPYGEQTKRELIRLGKLADHPGQFAP